MGFLISSRGKCEKGLLHPSEFVVVQAGATETCLGKVGGECKVWTLGCKLDRKEREDWRRCQGSNRMRELEI